MKPTTEQIIDWGRTALNETGALIPTEWNLKLLEAICSAAYEAGRKDENDACANVLDDMANDMAREMEPSTAIAYVRSKAAEIRSRGQQ